MKLKENWKRFWTLDRHHAGGFTLVELIVVIAILAILAGVGVPAYSAYVTKANKQADISLVSDIEHALTLAYYKGDLESVTVEGSTIETDSGFLMLSPTVAVNGHPIVMAAMENAFGSNWMNLQLKYDGWTVKTQVMSQEEASNVVNSNFATKYSPEELMAQVQAVTDAVNGLDIGGSGTLYQMYAYGDGKNAIDDVMKEYNITKDWDDLSSTEQSNLLVLASASSINGGTGAPAADLIPTYALYTAYAAENAEFKAAYDTFQNTISSVNADTDDAKIQQVKEAYRALSTAAGDGFATWRTKNEATNKAAFQAIMKGVSNAMKDNGDAVLAELGNASLFTSGAGSELYKQYLNSAYAMAGDADGMIAEYLEFLKDPENAGCVLVWYSVVDGAVYVDNSIAE